MSSNSEINPSDFEVTGSAETSITPEEQKPERKKPGPKPKTDTVKETIKVEHNSPTVIVAMNAPTDRIVILKTPNGDKDVYLKCGNSHLRGKREGVLTIGEYGYTEILRSDWEEIVKQRGKTKIFENGLIFACDTMEEATKEAASRTILRHGVEPVSPNKMNTQPGKASDL